MSQEEDYLIGPKIIAARKSLELRQVDLKDLLLEKGIVIGLNQLRYIEMFSKFPKGADREKIESALVEIFAEREIDLRAVKVPKRHFREPADTTDLPEDEHKFHCATAQLIASGGEYAEFAFAAIGMAEGEKGAADEFCRLNLAIDRAPYSEEPVVKDSLGDIRRYIRDNFRSALTEATRRQQAIDEANKGRG